MLNKKQIGAKLKHLSIFYKFALLKLCKVPNIKNFEKNERFCDCDSLYRTDRIRNMKKIKNGMEVR